MPSSRRNLLVVAVTVAASLAAIAGAAPLFAKNTPKPAPKTPAPAPKPADPPAKPKDLLDTLAASKDASFKTLLELVKAADLTATLKGKGPFTLFAPTDEAFNAIDAAKLADLKKPENKAQLKALLTYHLAPQKLLAADVAKLTAIKTVNGASLTVKVGEDKAWTVDDVKPAKTDLVAANGVFHVIGAVLMPKVEAPKDAPKTDPAMK